MCKVSTVYALITSLVLMFGVFAVQAACEDELAATTDLTAQGETVIDNRTGLTWMRCSVGQVYREGTCSGAGELFNWQQALEEAVDSVNSSALGGHSDWRLPNLKELASITEKRCSRPALDEAVFPLAGVNGSSAFPVLDWWTSSPDAVSGRSAENAWVVDFDLGRTDIAFKRMANLVRLVRGNP